MRLRLTLTIEARREPKPTPPAPEPERPPMVDGKGAFLMERAEPYPIGFRENPLPSGQPIYQEGA